MDGVPHRHTEGQKNTLSPKEVPREAQEPSDTAVYIVRGTISGLVLGIILGAIGGARLVKAEVEAFESASGAQTSQKFHELLDEVATQEERAPLSGSAIGVRAVAAANHIGFGIPMGMLAGLVFSGVRNRRRS